MLKPWIPVVAVLVLSSLAFAQRSPKQFAGAGVKSADDTCAFTFASGSGQSFTQYCVTANGNIGQFSTNSAEFLNSVAPATEGYGLCDFTAVPISYWDYASDASTNWNAATSTSTKNSVTVTRTTADGIWQLVQTITQMKASKTGYGAAKISMAITNLSNGDRFIQINRHANIDAGGNLNDFDSTSSFAFGKALATGPGLGSTSNFVTTKFDFGFAEVLTAPQGPDPCQISNPAQGFFEGDGSVEQLFNLGVKSGKKKTVSLTYAPI